MKTMMLGLLLLFMQAGAWAAPAPAAGEAPTGMILVEAESFSDLGGWVLDQQFMDQMGSPYLLAHGLGERVRDAFTPVDFGAGGRMRLWVRTKDWVARWNAPGTPGRFQVVIGGQAVPVEFGTVGADWHWQDGGIIEVPAGRAGLVLRDLTGFEGRCDALLFSADTDFVPPEGKEELAALRRRLLGLSETPREAGHYDLVVVGGGIAGSTAALAAARLGLEVALIQDRPVLGGNNSAEVRMGMSGNGNLEPYPRIGDVTRELEPRFRYVPGPLNSAESFEDERRLALVRGQERVTLFMEHRMNEVETAGARVVAVRAQNVRSGERIRLTGRLFADCTGDATLGVLAGADHEMTSLQHMGGSNLWNVVDTHRISEFPRCPWALDLTDKPFPGRGRGGQWDNRGLGALGQWFWESGFDWHPIEEVEASRDLNLRAMYGAWDALKNVDGQYPNHKLVWAAYIIGKRESIRLLGDVLLTVDDFTSGTEFADACVPCTWPIDLHYPHPDYSAGFEGQEFISRAQQDKYKTPYWVPYRTLYSRNIENLFMAGRNISVTHEALGPVRVMKTTGMMGEIVGMAAWICLERGVSPRGVYEQHLEELKALMRRGAGREHLL